MRAKNILFGFKICMKVTLNPNITNHLNANSLKNNKIIQHFCERNDLPQDLNNFSYGMVYLKNFDLASMNFKKAQKYLEIQKTELRALEKNEELSLSNFDLTKLEGIQDGIQVFKGLSMKQVAFVADEFYAVLVNRGCSNLCAHCMQDAKPQQHLNKHPNIINKMSIEDLNSLTDGFSTLSNRLGFNCIKENTYECESLFHDADGIEIEIPDEFGEILDFTDLNDKLFNTTGVKGIFDTSGWYPKNKKQQERAEKIVKYMTEGNGAKNIQYFYLSINPYHVINTKANLYKKLGFNEKADKFRNLYTDRMANAIFTFTPLMDKNKLSFITRAIDNPETPIAGAKVSDLKILMKEIFLKVQKKYEQDFETDKKFIKSYSQIDKKMKKLRNVYYDIEKISPYGRAKELFNKNSKVVSVYESSKNNSLKSLSASLKSTIYPWYRMIDANGKVYLTDFESNVPTEIQLNFKNKDKLTVPFSGIPENFVVTKQMIDRDY